MTSKIDVLKIINQLRTAAGHDTISALPMGLRSTPDGCVVARSLWDIEPEIQVFTSDIIVDNQEFAEIVLSELGGEKEINHYVTDSNEIRYIVSMSTDLAEFVKAFDNSEYPELVLTGSPADCFV